MKSFARIWFLSCLLAMSFAAGADDTAQILEQEQRFSDAIRGDWDALEVLLHEEFFYNTSDGTTIDKKPFIALMRSGAVQIGNLARLDTRVYFHAQVAIVTGVSNVQARVEGVEREVDARHLHVWVRQDERWQLTARQVTYTRGER